MKLKTAKLPVAVVMVSMLLLHSCGTAPTSDDAITSSEVSADMDLESNENVSAVQDLFHSVPSPMEIASILKKSGAEYDMTLLNDVKKVSDYSTSRSRALNLGIYGADLSYASIFNQNQESIIYLSCTKKLADNLGVTKAFDDSTIERMETNIDSRDSLLNIISETYYMLDGYLKENGRENLSAMMIAAGWIEGLYLATTIASKSQNPDRALVKRIAEQKLSLDNLKELIVAYNTNNELDDIIQDIEKLELAYADVEINKEATEAPAEKSGSTVIGSKTKTTISKESLAEITQVVSEIRQRYIS